MNRRTAVIAGAAAAVLVLGVFLLRGGQDPSDLRNWPGRSGPVVVFGDSLVEGYGAGPGEDFPSIMARVLDREVVNAGRSGDTTEDLLERLDDALAPGPRLVVVAIGGNDVLRDDGPERVEGRLTEVVRRLQEGGALVAVVGYRFGAGHRDLRSLVRGVAEETEAWYIDNPVKGVFNDGRYKSDWIHLNAAGYEILGERVAEAVRPLL